MQGELSLETEQLEFLVDGKPSFDVPVRDIAQCSNTRSDVGVHFHQYDTTSDRENDLLTEMHFVVPASNEALAALGDDTPAANLKQWIAGKVLFFLWKPLFFSYFLFCADDITPFLFYANDFTYPPPPSPSRPTSTCPPDKACA